MRSLMERGLLSDLLHGLGDDPAKELFVSSLVADAIEADLPGSIDQQGGGQRRRVERCGDPAVLVDHHREWDLAVQVPRMNLATRRAPKESRFTPITWSPFSENSLLISISRGMPSMHEAQ